jgi:uncharacterized membrane protein YkoI
MSGSYHLGETTRRSLMRRKLAIVAVIVVALGAISAGIAIAAGGGDDEEPLTGSALTRATAAALEHTGGGTVTETEVGDDGAAYGVEIRLDDGTQVEVNLDENFEVIGEEADDDGPNDEDGPGDDD